MSIIAPVSGATVGVHQIVVSGTVTPANAAVVVSGQPAQVVHGSFTRPVALAQATQKITVTAQANGYVAGTATTTVQYSPQIAAQLTAAREAQAQALKVASLPAPALSHAAALTSGPSSKAVNSAFAIPSSASSSGGSSGGSSGSGSSGGGTTTSPSKPAGGSPTTTTPAPPLTVAQIKTLWINGCVKASNGQKFVSYCTCTYQHLERNGWLKSRDRVLSLDKRLRRYDQTHNVADLPRFVRRAISACISKLPPLDPLTPGKPVVKKLPGLAHQRIPSPSVPISR